MMAPAPPPAAPPAAPPPAAPPAAARRWRLWPDSLFGRLLLALTAGLVLAQLLGAAINVAERDQLLNRGYGLAAAQRIADVVDLLDGLPEAERARVVQVFRQPPLVLSLHDAPSVETPAVLDRRGLQFVARLHSALDGQRALRVMARPGPAAERPDGPGGRGPHGRHGRGGDAGAEAEAEHDERRAARRAPGLVWRTEVQLRDGRWARFDAALPVPSERLPWRLAASLGVLLLATLVLGWVAVRWLVRPLKQLSDAAQGLGESLDRPPLPETGPREVRQAAQAFNTMQRRLAEHVQERTRLLTALSHDLKTPLTRMRLRAELLDDDEARNRFEHDLHEMEAMVGETLAFLRGLGGHEPRAPVDLPALLAALQQDQQAMGRDVSVQLPAQGRLPPLPAVASLLRRALGNLVDNAVLYGGRARLMLDDDAGQVVIRVLDDGPGIAPAELERVFEPFYRLEASRSRATGGTGLGLGIARNIAQLHGGTLTLHNRPEGGLEARLTLPRRDA
ncbi:ATP-binding protein [Aquabacterium sp. OR-4]|uniref:ATP-binding protein n=1 Tax=Aquabacterium sp. OR-4 TaxID=2978127 RepID=UPI0021B1620E|nr:ATP-binding protein [Aquabacterium sp. OR-4]MDT7837540.1 ATP-binding protein [Aquabacterium sp. OR-4]